MAIQIILELIQSATQTLFEWTFVDMYAKMEESRFPERKQISIL